MRLRQDLGFRRIAVVLAGGGAYGAYEAGALRTLNEAGLEPAIVAGVSVGALNAVAWLAHGGDTAPLERTWRTLRSAHLGIRWAMLALRAMGAFLVAIGTLQAVVLLAGLPAVAMARPFVSIHQFASRLRATVTVDLTAWILLAVLGLGIVALAPMLDDLLSRGALSAAPERLEGLLTFLMIVGGALYALALVLDLPWPLRLHFVAWMFTLLAWLVWRTPSLRSALGRVWLRLTPETGGRGLWRNRARRRLIRELVVGGDASRLLQGPVQLFVSACDLASGVITFFTNRPVQDSALERAGQRLLVEFSVLTTPAEIIDAAVASSAVPVLYEPFAFRGRRYIDSGMFVNQPLRAVAAAGADAVVLVVVSPSAGPRPESTQANLIEIAGRLSEIANWRDLQTELRHLPPGLSREGLPARVCVIEPETPLEGAMFAVDPERAARFIERGARDAAAALTRAGWVTGAAERSGPA